MKSSLLLSLFVACIGGLFTSCQQAATSTATTVDEINLDSVRAEIEALNITYANAINAKDVETVLAFYAPDAIVMPVGEPVQAGTEAIKKGYLAEFEANGNSKISFTTKDIFAAGKYATETGVITLKDSTDAVIYTGKYMVLFEKRDGRYVALRDIWNSDNPE